MKHKLEQFDCYECKNSKERRELIDLAYNNNVPIFNNINTFQVKDYSSLVFNNNKLAGCRPKRLCFNIPECVWLTKKEFINKIKGI